MINKQGLTSIAPYKCYGQFRQMLCCNKRSASEAIADITIGRAIQ